MGEARGICNNFRRKLEGPFLLRECLLHFQNPLVMHLSSLETQNQYLHILIQTSILEQCFWFLSALRAKAYLFPQTPLHWQIYSKMTQWFRRDKQGYSSVLQ